MAFTGNTSHEIAQSFLTIKATAQKYKSAGFTEPSLRWLAFHRNTNGFGPAFLKIGRKLLIDEAAFVRCLREHSVTKSTV